MFLIYHSIEFLNYHFIKLGSKNSCFTHFGDSIYILPMIYNHIFTHPPIKLILEMVLRLFQNTKIDSRL